MYVRILYNYYVQWLHPPLPHPTPPHHSLHPLLLYLSPCSHNLALLCSAHVVWRALSLVHKVMLDSWELFNWQSRFKTWWSWTPSAVYVQLSAVLYVSLPLLANSLLVRLNVLKIEFHTCSIYCIARHKMLLLIPQCKEQWGPLSHTNSVFPCFVCLCKRTYLHSDIRDYMSTWPHHQLCVSVWFLSLGW